MKQRKEYTPQEALQYLAGLCARSEQCEFDLRRKLSTRGVTGSEADGIIDYLIDHNFLDEMRFARAFCRDKARFSRWGRVKIRAHLLARRVGREAIESGLAAIDADDYLDGLQRLVAQASVSIDLHDRDDRLKLMRRLASRGFEPSLISDAISRRAAGEEDTDDL